MNTATPKTIPEYLDQLRYELRNADPALLQDALYDAEEYLRSELAENPSATEAEMLARIATSYGAPEEVAAIYRDTEVQVSQALRTPLPPPRRSALGRFFGVIIDPRAWAGLFYMLLSLATGIVYFTTVVTGLSLSAGLAILIIGIPVAILFGGFGAAGSLLQRRLGLPDASVLVLQGIAFVLILASEALRDVDWKAVVAKLRKFERAPTPALPQRGREQAGVNPPPLGEGRVGAQVQP